jgi:hypothetical protein
MLAGVIFAMSHNAASGTCLVCYEDIEHETYLEYRVSPTSPWIPSKFCSICLQMLLDTKFEAYMTGVATSTCEAELRRYVEKGPPIYIEDVTGFPVQPGLSAFRLLWSE